MLFCCSPSGIDVVFFQKTLMFFYHPIFFQEEMTASNQKVTLIWSLCHYCSYVH